MQPACIANACDCLLGHGPRRSLDVRNAKHAGIFLGAWVAISSQSLTWAKDS